LIDGWLIERERISGGLRLVFDNRPGLAEAAGELLRWRRSAVPGCTATFEMATSAS
jgi:hypothetical protein